MGNLAEREAGGGLRIVDTSKPTLATLLIEYEAVLRGKDITNGRVEDVLVDLRRAIECRGWAWPSQITDSDIVTHLERRKAAGNSGTTRRMARANIRMFCAWLVKKGLLESNPTDLVPTPQKSKRKARYVPTQDEVVRLILAASIEWRTGDRWLVYLLAACTGLRVGTLKALTWDMVHLERMADGLAWLELPGTILKNGEDSHVWLTRECAERLAKHSQYSRGVRERSQVFANVPKPESFTRDIERAGLSRRAGPGSPTFTRHSLRHFYKTWLESMSAYSFGEMQSQMGHLTPAMTRKVYGDKANPMLGAKIWRAQALLPTEFPGNRGRPTKKNGKFSLDNRSSGRQTDASLTGSDNVHQQPTSKTPTPAQPGDCERSQDIVLGVGVSFVDSERSIDPPHGLGTEIGADLSNLPTPISREKHPDLIGAYSRVALALADAEKVLARLLQKE